MNEMILAQIPTDEIRQYCVEQPIRRLSVFGSAARGELTDESDIDLLVEYMPDARISYFDMGRHVTDLIEIVGRHVDLCTPKSLSRYFRQDVIDSALPIYEKEP